MQHSIDKPVTEDIVYTGRFAPSPTGPVHFGTLLAAVGSYLQAKTNNGKWLLRMEDVDTTRSVDGADTDILHTLEVFGFEWDGDVVYQSKRTELYQQAMDILEQENLLFACLCSRKQLAESGSDIYPGTCRNRRLPRPGERVTGEHAVRVIVDDSNIVFHDCVMGTQAQSLARECGDFVIKRRDGLFAYQLAVVVDDALQGITEIVRGADLLDSTPRQICRWPSIRMAARSASQQAQQRSISTVAGQRWYMYSTFSASSRRANSSMLTWTLSGAGRSNTGTWQKYRMKAQSWASSLSARHWLSEQFLIACAYARMPHTE